MALQKLVQMWDRLCREDDDFLSQPTANHRMVMRLYPQIKDAGVRSVLDVGCGNGRLMREFELLGMHATGTEIVPSLFRQLKGLLVYPMPIHAVKNIGKFDLVLLVDVLECMTNIEDIKSALINIFVLSEKCMIVTIGCVGKFRQFSMPFEQWKTVIQDCIGEPEIYRDYHTGADLFCVWK